MLPLSVRSLVGRSAEMAELRDGLEPLDGPVREVIAVAAVLGREFDVAVVAAVREERLDVVLDHLGEAEESHVVARVGLGRWSFSHALLREAVYEELPGARRVDAHCSAAHTLGAGLGASRWRLLTRHILPNSIAPVLVSATLAVGTAILSAAGLAFLGLGPNDASIPEWGKMLAESEQVLQTSPQLVLFPGLAIVLVVLGFNLVGDALRDALDPKRDG